MSIPNPGYSRHFKYLKGMPIIAPFIDVAKAFVKIVTPLYKQWTNNVFGNIELTKQRDELLPLLMNGQVNCDLLITEIQPKVLGQCEYFRILMAGAWMHENVEGGGGFFSGKMRGEGWILDFFGYICRLKLLTSINRSRAHT